MSFISSKTTDNDQAIIKCGYACVYIHLLNITAVPSVIQRKKMKFSTISGNS